VQDLHFREVPDSSFPEFVRSTREPGFIEPKWGYIFTDTGKLVPGSVPHAEASVAADWRLGSPSPLAVSGYCRQGLHAKQRYPKVVSLRYFWEWNYYHFYFDVLGKLFLLDSTGLDTNVPLVLGPYVDELPWPREILSLGSLKDRNWIVSREPVYAQETVYCRAMSGYKEKLEYLLGLMGVTKPLDSGGIRLFVGRSGAKTRQIQNESEVYEVLKGNGFEVIPSLEGMSIRTQIDLFSSARHVVAVHGAGITNCIFRRTAPMSLLELHAANYISTDFKRMCLEYGRHYATLAGSPAPGAPQHASFHLDRSTLELALRSLLDT
jgi:capsular polysaccharide biosynthesis protein